MEEAMVLFPLNTSVVRKLNNIIKNVPGLDSTTDAIMWAIDNVPLRAGDTTEEQEGTLLEPGGARRLLQFGNANGIAISANESSNSMIKVIIDPSTINDVNFPLDDISEIRLTRE